MVNDHASIVCIRPAMLEPKGYYVLRPFSVFVSE